MSDGLSSQAIALIKNSGETDELLRLAVQVGGIGIYESDLERNRTRFSPELCAILGLAARAEMTHDEASRFFDTRDRAEVAAKVEAAASTADRGKWSGVHRVVRDDGTIRWVSIQGRRIYRDTADGPLPVRSIGTVIDITHLKETEAALRDSELRLRLALEAAEMGTFEADIATSQAFIDRQEARLLGLPDGTRVVSPEEWRKRMPMEDLQESDAKKERLTRHREAYHHEFRLAMPDGSERWLCAHAAVRSNRIFGVSFDVTKRKSAEAALRQSEARLRIATGGAALGVFEWNANADRAVWENDRMYEIFGRKRDDGPLSKQQLVGEYLEPEDGQEFEAALSEAMHTCGNFHSVCRIRRKDRSRRWLQIDGTFEATSAGGPMRLVGVVADITVRKRLERRARDLSRRLATIQEEERKNIARELHDSTAQHLVAASLTLMSLRPGTGLTAKQRKLWDELEASIDEAAKELRTFSYLMDPPALRAQGLRATLLQYVDGFWSRSGINVELRSGHEADGLPPRVQRSLFRIVQAALANVFHHASASQVSVQLRCVARRVHLIISDNGCGLQRVRRHGGCPTLRLGVGLRGIRARLDELGGALRIIRLRPHGTRIHAALPVGPVRPNTSRAPAPTDCHRGAEFVAAEA
jgi:PAS domain S-box-containing protein